MLLCICLLFTIAAATSAQGISTADGKIKMTIVTTAGCGDTVNFITKQLSPVYDKFSEHLILEFVPWGRTRRNRNGGLVCQFGTKDCFANRVHRCTLDMLKNNQYNQVKYMVCEFSLRSAYKNADLTCAKNAGVNLSELESCVKTPKGDILDAEDEAKAAEPMRVVNFVPAIAFNGVSDYSVQRAARTDLKTLVCGALQADPSTRSSVTGFC